MPMPAVSRAEAWAVPVRPHSGQTISTRNVLMVSINCTFHLTSARNGQNACWAMAPPCGGQLSESRQIRCVALMMHRSIAQRSLGQSAATASKIAFFGRNWPEFCGFDQIETGFLNFWTKLRILPDLGPKPQNPTQSCAGATGQGRDLQLWLVGAVEAGWPANVGQTPVKV